MDKDKQLQILRLFLALEKVDSNALSNLEKLVKMAQTNPAKYNLALKFL